MLAIRIAETDPAKHGAREAWLPAHRAHLRSGAVAVLQSDPLFANPVRYGALVIADVADLDDSSRFSDEDHSSSMASIAVSSRDAGRVRSVEA